MKIGFNHLSLEGRGIKGEGDTFYTARIPIPRGHEDEAREIVARLKKRGKVK